jgi:ferritin-like metal-binding protein YciE
MAKSETPGRDALLVKYLNEAYGKEKQLETALELQIGRSQHDKIIKGLKEHLKVTKRQARELSSRIKALGGKATTGADLPGPDAVGDVAGGITSLANKAVAAAKGPVQVLRGTSAADNEIRNLRDCYWNEAEEIAHYAVIETLATQLGDRETARMAKTFRKEEEKMQALIERQLAPLLREVVKEEVPAAERRSSSPRRSTSRRKSSSKRSSSTSRSSGTSRSTSSSRSSSSSSRSTGGTRKASTTAKSAAKSARSTAKAAATGAKAGAKAASSSAKRSAAGSKGGAKKRSSSSRSTAKKS